MKMRKIFSRLIVLSLFVSFAVIVQTSSVSAATYSVTTNANAGAGSLRQAITDANANPGADEITFNVPGAGPHEIVTTSYLPVITEGTYINGSSQPGTVCGTASMQPQIIIKGYSRLDFGATSDNSAIRGVAFPNSMVVGHNSVYLSSDNFTLTCSFFGTSDGATSGDRGNFRILDGAHNVSIGTTDEADRNIFIGANRVALESAADSSGVIQNNYFGTNPAGTEIAGSYPSYIALGGSWDITANIFAYNPNFTDSTSSINIYNYGNGSSGKITKNYVGTDKTRTKDFGSGADYAYAISNNSSDYLVGGTDPADKNYIYNWNRGIYGYNSSALGNQFKDVYKPIEASEEPKILSFQENGSNTDFVVELRDSFDDNTDYRVELYSNPAERNSRGGSDTTDFIGMETVTRGDYSDNHTFTITVPGTGYTNPAVTATKIDDSADGFARTSAVGKYKIPTDLKFEKVGTLPSCVVKGDDFSYQVKITNNGPNTIENFEVDFYDQNGFFTDIDPQITGGTATSGSLDPVPNNTTRWLWSGTIAVGKTVIITVDSSVNPANEDAYAELNPRLNDYNSDYYRDTNDNNGSFYQDIPVCGKQADLKLDFERVSGEVCVTPGEQDRVYRTTITNNGPNPVTSFGLETPYEGDGMHENMETELVGGTATETTNFALADGYSDQWGWQGDLQVGETLIFETALDIVNSTDNNGQNLRYRVSPYNSETYTRDYYDTNNNNNYNEINGRSFREYYCGSTYNLRMVETSNNTQKCIEANQKDRTYKFSITNDGDETITTFAAGGQFPSDSFENIRLNATGGTGSTASLVDASDTFGPGAYIWTGTLAPGKTLEFTLKADIKSPSTEEPQELYLGAFIQDKENISSQPYIYKYEFYCDYLIDVSSEIRLDEPGLIEGQSARYRLLVKNVGAKTLTGEEGTAIFMYAYFSSDLNITDINTPDGFNCEQAPAESVPEIGYEDGSFLICEQSGATSLAPGQSLEFIVDVSVSQVTTSVSGLKKTVKMFAFAQYDPDFFEFQLASEGGLIDLFGFTTNSFAQYLGSQSGSSFDLASTGGGVSGPTAQVSATPMEQINALNQAYRDAQLARSGEDQQKAKVIGLSIASFAGVGLATILVHSRFKKTLYKL